MSGLPNSKAATLVAAHHLGEALQPLVARACDVAQSPIVEWRGETLTPKAEPGVLISCLPQRERRISDDVVMLMTRTWPGLPLLLLCSDELIRPTLSLQGGRVTLLGPPLTEDRIASRLRILLAGRREDSSGSPVLKEPSPHLIIKEQSTKTAYVALVGSSTPDQPEASACLPSVEATSEQGVSTVLSISPQVDTHNVSQVVEATSREERDEDKDKALGTVLGPTAAMVQLTNGNDWLLYWPDPSAMAFLCSSARLPQAYELSGALARNDSTFMRLPAAAGDVLIAVWGAPLNISKADLQNAALMGGPTVLDLIAKHLAANPTLSSSAIMEVR